MNQRQEQLIHLLINNTQPTWEIEAIHMRCCIYYGEENAFEKCQDIIDFATVADIGLLESFRLQVEVTEMTANKADF